MMRELRLLGVFFVIAAGSCFSQIPNDSGSQSSTTPSITDCTDPSQADSPECAAQAQTSGGTQGRGNSPSTVTIPQLRSPIETNQTPAAAPPNPSQVQWPKSTVWPETEFEQMVADSFGRPLPLFGQSLFDQPPSPFAPMDLMGVPSDYVIGPGDGLQIKIWGQLAGELRVTVDRTGQIYIPQVGQISVAGVHYGELEEHLKNEICKGFKNFNLTVNVGGLRSIQVLVVGNARYPGTYTIGSLSTLVNAIFASGGPTPQGSLRHIQVRRDGAIITDFDFYDLLIKGDKSKDVRLQPGDVLYIPHVGPLVAISGSVNSPAIYEMKDSSTLNDLIEVAGDLSTVADTSRVTVDRFVEHQARKTLEFPYDGESRALPLKDGDIVRIFSIVPRFEDTVTLRGNVANPGRYAWKAGMRVRDLIPNAQALLTRGYWRNRAAIVNGRGTKYPVVPERSRTVLDQPQNEGTSPSGNGATGSNPSGASPDRMGSANPADAANATTQN